MGKPTEDLTGRRFGKLVVIRRTPDYVNKDGIKRSQWLCRCDCGNEKVLLSYRLKSGNDTSCGKCEKTIDMIGQRYGLLTVIEKAPDREHENSKPTKMWKCVCDCGNTVICSRQALTSGEKKDCGCVKEGKYLVGKRYGKLVIRKIIREKGREARVECICDCGNIATPLLSRVINNKVYSCGCYRAEKSKEIHTKHNMSKTRIYKVWKKINDRCNNPGNKSFHYYGGRGIKICDEWSGEHGAENFIKWAYENGYDENAPKGEYTIDRIDVDKDYAPSNCRFVSMRVQNNNTRKTIKKVINGEELTVSEISEKYGIRKDKIRYRIKCGMEEDKIIHKGNLTEKRD